MNEVVRTTPSNPAPMPDNALVPVDATERLIQTAFSQNASIEQLERLFALKERAEANAARNAYVQAMAEFKKSPPTIVKEKLVDFTNKAGQRTRYMHATLGDVCNAVIEALAQHGFSHRWATAQQGDKVIVTCIITHRLGHSESMTMEGKPDDTGNKNPIQQISSTQTYFQRHTLLGVCGLTSNDIRDDDGQGGPDKQQAAFQLQEWLDQVEQANDKPALDDVWVRGIKAMKKANAPQHRGALQAACKARADDLAPAREPGQEG